MKELWPRQLGESIIGNHCWLIWVQQYTCMGDSNIDCANGGILGLNTYWPPFFYISFHVFHILVNLTPCPKLWYYDPYKRLWTWTMFHTRALQSSAKDTNFVCIVVSQTLLFHKFLAHPVKPGFHSVNRNHQGSGEAPSPCCPTISRISWRLIWLNFARDHPRELNKLSQDLGGPQIFGARTGLYQNLTPGPPFLKALY